MSVQNSTQEAHSVAAGGAAAGVKNIVLCSDGTGNTANKNRGTNVFKLYEALALNDATQQVAFYDDGVGTESFKPMRLLGGAFGYGLTRNVKELYASLCRVYRPGDRIYLFGFSRGAFTVRTLAGLISRCGILHAGDDLEDRVDRIWSEYRDHCRPTLLGLLWKPVAKWMRRKQPPLERHREVPVKFIGVWDTVAAVGFPVDELALLFNHVIWRFTFPDRVLGDKVERACHALSIDDERRTFHPLMWEPDRKRPERIEQVWFAGVHSNVGGGYPRQGVSLVTLDWMMDKAAEQGVQLLPSVRDHYRYAANVHDKLYDSRAGMGVYYRYAPRDIARLAGAENPKIHVSVFERIWHATDRYAPPPFPDSFELTGQRDLPLHATLQSVAESTRQKGAQTRARALPWIRARRASHYLLGLTTAAIFLEASRTGSVPAGSGTQDGASAVMLALATDSLDTLIALVKELFVARPMLAVTLAAALLAAYSVGALCKDKIDRIYRRYWRSVFGPNAPALQSDPPHAHDLEPGELEHQA